MKPGINNTSLLLYNISLSKKIYWDLMGTENIVPYRN